ncbi:MAG TPA: hypothetical protein IAD27_05550 [Candidatus Merdousia gallistercoris]|nr:hypothetical protein [Candidatus Merdousia gallistercoris]
MRKVLKLAFLRKNSAFSHPFNASNAKPFARQYQKSPAFKRPLVCMQATKIKQAIKL